MTSLPVSAPSVSVSPLSQPTMSSAFCPSGVQISTAGPIRVNQGQLLMNVSDFPSQENRAAVVVHLLLHDIKTANSFF